MERMAVDGVKGEPQPTFNLIDCTGVQIMGNKFDDDRPDIRVQGMTKGDIQSDIKIEIPSVN